MAGRGRKKGGDLGGLLGSPRLAQDLATRGGRAAPEVVSPSSLGLNSRAAEATHFFESRNWEEEEKEAGKGCWEEARRRLRAPRSLLAGWGGAAQVPCSSQVAEKGGGRDGREP